MVAWSPSGHEVVLRGTDRSEDEEGFIVERKTARPGAEFAELARVKEASYRDATVQPGIVYTSRARAFNAAGTSTFAETMIRVEASRDSTITVQRGLDRESLSCTPNCQPAVQLGDSATYFGAASGQADARRKLATSGAAPGAER